MERDERTVVGDQRAGTEEGRSHVEGSTSLTYWDVFADEMLRYNRMVSMSPGDLRRLVDMAISEYGGTGRRA